MFRLNKKGAAIPPIGFVVIGIVVLVAVVLAFFIVINTVDFNVKDTSIDTETVSHETVNENLKFLDFIVGPIPAWMVPLINSPWSLVIIVVAMWGLLWVTFGDIIATFGTFNIWVSWTIAALISSSSLAVLKFSMAISLASCLFSCVLPFSGLYSPSNT